MSREEFLESLPVGTNFDPCRCSGCKGYVYDKDRGNMLVCLTCRKPSGAHRGFSPYCYECGKPFTYKVVPAVPEKFPFCPDCE